jgi:formate/nitrite transporter FocA (FNT family)
MEKTFYERLIPSQKARSIINRFLKAFISGAFSALGLITIAMPQNWTEVPMLLSMLALSAMYGGLTGVIMAGQKWASWKE